VRDQSSFGSSQLSQFLDQTNPWRKLTHKRADPSALGQAASPVAGRVAVRDIHPFHYGQDRSDMNAGKVRMPA